MGHHCDGKSVDPASVDRSPTLADEKGFRIGLGKYLPDAVGPTVAVKICLYTLSPDRDFIVDRLPGDERVTVACGFSGHGYKFAPVVGEALADLALSGRSDLPIGFLGLSRFG